MLYRVLDLRFSRRLGGIDDEPLQRLLHGHELVARTERLYHHDGLPHLLVSVLYRPAALGLDRSYVGRILRLTMLAPAIVEMIIEGREPSGMSLERLVKGTSLVWAEQGATGARDRDR